MYCISSVFIVALVSTYVDLNTMNPIIGTIFVHLLRGQSQTLEEIGVVFESSNLAKKIVMSLSYHSYWDFNLFLSIFDISTFLNNPSAVCIFIFKFCLLQRGLLHFGGILLKFITFRCCLWGCLYFHHNN